MFDASTEKSNDPAVVIGFVPVIVTLPSALVACTLVTVPLPPPPPPVAGG
jgi:hypothetical protein